MSKNSKNSRRIEKARDIAALHKSGEKGPAKTMPLHHKRWGYRTNPEVQKRIAEQLKATSEPPNKTAGKKILEGAGAASRDD